MASLLPAARRPSLFRSGLIGYLCASAIGVVATFISAIEPRDYNEVAAYKILVCVGGVGALTGCLYALNRRKSLGQSHPEVDEWKQFIGTAGFYLLAAIVLVGSLGIAVLAALIFDAAVTRTS